jgi:hypothetical protein
LRTRLTLLEQLRTGHDLNDFPKATRDAFAWDPGTARGREGDT